MSVPTVVYDACVLYPAPLRSLLMYLAMTGLYQARWTHAIHEEWMRNVQKDYPHFTRQQAERIRDLMNLHVADCLVSGYEDLIPTLSLPDSNDRHVLAAAVSSGADQIVTFNLSDFPERDLQRYGIQAVHPDDFIVKQMEYALETVCGAAKLQRASLKNPPMSSAEFLDSLARQRLFKTVARLREHEEWI